MKGDGQQKMKSRKRRKAKQPQKQLKVSKAIYIRLVIIILLCTSIFYLVYHRFSLSRHSITQVSRVSSAAWKTKSSPTILYKADFTLDKLDAMIDSITQDYKQKIIKGGLSTGSEFLQLTLDALRAATYAYYDWEITKLACGLVTDRDIFHEVFTTVVDTMLLYNPELYQIFESHPRPYYQILGDYFHKYGKNLNFSFFLNPSLPILSVEVAEIIEEKEESHVLWGYKVTARVLILGDILLKNILLYHSREDLLIGMITLDTVVCYYPQWNKDFIEQVKEGFANYPNKPIGIIKNNYDLLWALRCKEIEDIGVSDKELFVDTFMKRWLATSVIHEFAHILMNRGMTPQEKVRWSNSGDDELFAYLTELRYGEMQYESLANFLRCGKRKTPEIRKLYEPAMMAIYTGFARRIYELNKKGVDFQNIDCSRIDINTRSGMERIMYQFHKLQREQIRRLAQYLFERKKSKREQEADSRSLKGGICGIRGELLLFV